MDRHVYLMLGYVRRQLSQEEESQLDTWLLEDHNMDVFGRVEHYIDHPEVSDQEILDAIKKAGG